MDWVKKNWIVMVCGLVAVAGIGIGIWAMMGFRQIQADANGIAAVAGTLEGLQRGATNLKAINDAREHYKGVNSSTDEASLKEKSKNLREPLRNDVFPTPQTPEAPYNFRTAYREAMRRLPQILNAERAPTGDTVDRIVNRMEEKAKKEANVNTVGDQLRIPKPPDVPKMDPTAAAPVATAGPMAADRGQEPAHVGGGEDPSFSGRMSFGGNKNNRISFGRNDQPPAARAAPTPGSATASPAAPPAVKIPSKEQLMPEAKSVATYETARRIWTYIDEGSLEMHPIGSPSFMKAPDELDMWAAQMFYWIEKDVVEALARVNKQATASLPEDQHWVAYLPVKHLVSLTLSDYVISATTDVMSHNSSAAVLRRNIQNSSARTGAAVVSFGDKSNAYTGRTRSDEYDVVHVAMNLVVDARDLPKVLVELSKQNLITPLNVQYRNVDVIAAREAGYLYGSGPVIDVDMVCEMLFYRSIYEAWMPELVRKMLSGEIAAEVIR